ncbi:MAG TPA: TlpA disulfide reductase family protein [Actinomycetota bacterium]|nr:TlpA disulfide reductase family protein [Actinomycetota bacterium]
MAPPPPSTRVLAVIVSAGILAAACVSDRSSTARRDEPLPRIAGESLTGEPIDADEYADGDVLVINVWADWCDPCRREQPTLVRLAERYEDRGVRFLGINYQDDRDAARAWVEEFDVPYPSLFDPSGRTAVDLGFPALPDTYVVDREGTVRWVVFGETDAEELTGLIEDVLA